MGSVSILCINVNVTIKFDANADANIDIDAKCERTLSIVVSSGGSCLACTINVFLIIFLVWSLDVVDLLGCACCLFKCTTL